MTRVLVDLSILTTSSRARGLGRHASELALGLADASPEDVELLFVESLEPGGRATIVGDPREAVARLRDPNRAEMGHLAWTYSGRLGLDWAARHVGADVLHVPHAEFTPLFGGPARRLTTCHDLIPLLFPKQYLRWRDGYRVGRRLIDRRRYRSADHVIAISEATAQDVCAMTGLSPSKVSVVLHGVEADAFEPDEQPEDAATRSRLGVRGPYALYVGAADWRKNAEGMFAGLARARRSVPDLRLVWAGRLDAGRIHMLNELARELGVGDAVRLCGEVDDCTLHSLYRGATTTIMVSRYEGFGLPVLEAMSIGSPVLTSDVSSLPEVAGDAALQVGPEDHDAIGRALVTLATDEDERRRLRTAGLARARVLSRARMTDRILEVYRHVAGARPGPAPFPPVSASVARS